MEAASTRAITIAEPGRARPLAEALRALADSVPGVFALCLAGAVAIRYEGLFPSIMNWDESLYAVMAQHWLAGELPYQAVWDQHSVGLPALFAAVLAVFPKSILAIRLTACAAVAVAATAVYFIARLIDGRRRLPGAVAALLYLFWTARWWGLPANTELYLNALIAPAIYLLLRSRPSLASVCLGGFLLGLALQVKHVALAETGLFFAALLWSARGQPRQQVRNVLGAAAAFALPTLVVVGYFWWEGLAGAYFHATVTDDLIYVADRAGLATQWPTLRLSWGLPILVAAGAAVFLMKRPEPRPAFVLLWTIAAAIDVALPGWFWDHYFLLLAPSGAVLGGYLFARATEGRPRRSALVLAAALVVTDPWGLVKDSIKAHASAHHDVPRIVAHFIGKRLPPNASIFVFNYQPVIYFLTGSRLPTRYVQPDAWTKRFVHVSGVIPVRELEAVFRRKPEFVVIAGRDWNGMGADTWAVLQKHLAASYERKLVVVDSQNQPEPVTVEIYHRIPESFMSDTD